MLNFITAKHIKTKISFYVIIMKQVDPSMIRTGIKDNITTFFRLGLYFLIQIEQDIELKNPKNMGALSSKYYNLKVTYHSDLCGLESERVK